jgi:hypothetical protein
VTDPARKAARLTAKRRAKDPLFAAAGLVPDVTVEEVRLREERLAAASVAYWARMTAGRSGRAR